MPEITSPRPSDRVETDPVTARVRDTRTGLAALIQEAEEAREQRAETAAKEGSAVCAWNHFENIPTFYNWNNRPR
ncbi:multiple cyclophane-containing RiPP AmcA [Actinoplanes sp. NPDC049548]|uniref:multiple cyclophane-containing RiPP AmcA n=1 Tax=Actinoplanes sp. NPDC049548 TaxID=3155152 RepID=UPI00342AFBAE